VLYGGVYAFGAYVCDDGEGERDECVYACDVDDVAIACGLNGVGFVTSSFF
jgi:hypothetical protein